MLEYMLVEFLTDKNGFLFWNNRWKLFHGDAYHIV